MRSYREYQENQGYDTLFINGFLESTTEKMILDAIINDFVQTTSISPKKSKSDLSQIDTIMNFYRKDDAPLLFIFINNIESGGLSKSFYTLSKLVALDKIKLICSVDKVSFWIDKGVDCKVGCVFSMVIWSDFHIGQERDDNHREDAPHFTTPC